MELSKTPRPEERRYIVTCRVLVKEVSYEDEQSTGTTTVTESLVFLLPEQSTQRDLFYNAWLPDTADTPVEIVCEAGHPVYGMFRAALWRRSQFTGDIHLFVMSKGAEEELKQINGKRIELTVYGEQEDQAIDGAHRDWELPYNKNKGQAVEKV
jgi:hypothetical protein